jgi:hypothetical protein
MMIADFGPAAGLLQQAHAAAAGDAAVQALLAKLDRSHTYVQNEMELRLSLLLNARGWSNRELSKLSQLLEERTSIIQASSNDGVILHDGRIP